MRSLFHVAFNVTHLDGDRRFYGGVLGCTEGRSADSWVDFHFMGHQLSPHLGQPFKTERTGHVGDTLVPMPHFGLMLGLADWQAMAQRLKAAGTDFLFAPQVRFEGQPGEQWTMFFCDPFGNPLEIKGFRDLDAVYAACGWAAEYATAQRRAAPSKRRPPAEAEPMQGEPLIVPLAILH